ncbi:hypothetical protein [Phenylobacterium sp.]|uniref:hypothetical protein n=1 Tax=Phenylobacterium sp. TaxID=1871053 RepID=UPI00286AD8C6|nr:hypothetical protein [Phenylobacterium sp.]
MDLIERYLAAVARNLPGKQAGDITAELRDVLLSRVEDLEATLGRPLERAEVEQLLIDFGHPLVVAWRYRKVQHLIGPEIFPFWWAGVKVVLSLVLGLYLVLVILGVLLGKSEAEFRRGVPDIWYVAVYLFGLVTLVCAGIERFGKTQALRKWKPSRLPPAGGKPRSRIEAVVEGGMTVVFILWWTGLIHFRDALLEHLPPWTAVITADLAPVWSQYHWPILSYAAMDLAVNLMIVFRPAALRLNAGLSLVRYLVGAVILLGVLRAGHWLVVAGPRGWSADVAAQVQTNFDIGMRLGIYGAIAVMLAKAALEVWRLYKIRRAEAPI